jgi:hypothetical protein
MMAMRSSEGIGVAVNALEINTTNYEYIITTIFNSSKCSSPALRR